MKKTIVMKFGGAAVATVNHFSKIADIVIERSKGYDRTAIVVSAMGTMTDDLIALAKQVHPNPPRREHDMLITAGERISIALLSMALAAKERIAVSFTGSQSGIITSDDHANATIVDVRPHRLLPHLDNGSIVIVAGFQGVSTSREITTLGRGGSDTTAVALATALEAYKVEFFKDVEGIYDKDPQKHCNAAIHHNLSYKHAMKISTSGAEVLHPRCIMLAERNCIPLHVLPFHNLLTKKPLGTIIFNECGKRPQVPIYEPYKKTVDMK